MQLRTHKPPEKQIRTKQPPKTINNPFLP